MPQTVLQFDKKQHAHARSYFRDSSTARIRARFSAFGATSGKRHTAFNNPISAMSRFHRNRIGFHKIDFHQRMKMPVNFARLLHNLHSTQDAPTASFRPEFRLTPPRSPLVRPARLVANAKRIIPRQDDEFVRDNNSG